MEWEDGVGGKSPESPAEASRPPVKTEPVETVAEPSSVLSADLGSLKVEPEDGNWVALGGKERFREAQAQLKAQGEESAAAGGGEAELKEETGPSAAELQPQPVEEQKPAEPGPAEQQSHVGPQPASKAPKRPRPPSESSASAPKRPATTFPSGPLLRLALIGLSTKEMEEAEVRELLQGLGSPHTIRAVRKTSNKGIETIKEWHLEYKSWWKATAALGSLMERPSKTLFRAYQLRAGGWECGRPVQPPPDAEAPEAFRRLMSRHEREWQRPATGPPRKDRPTGPRLKKATLRRDKGGRKEQAKKRDPHAPGPSAKQ